MRSTFDSKKYIIHLANQLVTNFAFANNATTSGLIGEGKENEILRKLKLLLPRTIDIGSGCIIDSYGRASRQMDIVIYEKEICPVFSINDSKKTTYFPCEGVIAAGEIKSHMNTKEIKNIFAKSKSLKTLERYSVLQKNAFGNDYYPYRSYNSTTAFDTTADDGLDQKNKLTDQIFFFALAGDLELKAKTFVDRMEQEIHKCTDGEEINSLVILNDGVFIYTSWEVPNIGIQHLKKDSHAFHFIKRSAGNFEYLLKILNTVITKGRTSPITAFDRYLNASSPIETKEIVNSMKNDLFRPIVSPDS